MRQKKYSEEHGATAGCTLRLAEGTKYSGDTRDREEAENFTRPEIVYADSWFGSMVSDKK